MSRHPVELQIEMAIGFALLITPTTSQSLDTNLG